MLLVISFDGREAFIKGAANVEPMLAAIRAKNAKLIYFAVGQNCKEILVFPGKHAGTIDEMYIDVSSISAVRFASPTSSVKK